ncbi:hypothetical protein MMB232_02176 [Brevundimonas subvibrioides]|uniref:hypothetical protein n=1 Tax=Brevundimonas subvibrioides TaxID=74313 RepID=UPI0032D5A4E9
MAAKLKVFIWSDGFHAFTVAAPSRPKALAAWGVDQDLFKTGLAHEVTDDVDRAAALADPGAVVTRGLAVNIGKTTRRKPSKTPTPTARARKRVEDLEARLAALDLEQADALDALTARRVELDREAASLERDQSKAREALKRDLKRARGAAR